MRVAHLVVPGRLDQRTGGYLYDSRIVEGLRGLGWDVRVHELDGRFPHPDDEALRSAGASLSSVPNGGLAILDGLGFLALRPRLDSHARRLRLVGLVHHLVSEDLGIDVPLDPVVRRVEAEALVRCAGVIVTSPYTVGRLRTLGVPRNRVRVVVPGTKRAKPARGPGAEAPPALLCVGSIVPRKAQHVLVRALSRLRGEAWTCVFAGSLERDAEYAAEVRRLVRAAELEDRVSFLGECDEEQLDRLYDGSTVFVLPSHYEGYGMAVAEALARGLPIVATTGGAVPFTAPADASLLVAPGDDEGLALCLARFIADRRSTAAPTAETLAAAARSHAARLPDWPDAARAFQQALLELSGEAPTVGAEAHSAGGLTSDTGEQERFPADWLDLREPTDHRSRSPALLTPLETTWRTQRWHRVLDLGSGTGSNLRYLAPKFPGHQAWTLVDHDPDLLTRITDSPFEEATAYRVVADLSVLGHRLVHTAHLVTASALLDLVSGAWLEALVHACRAASCGALFALTYDGRIEWSPADPDDALVRDAVNEHQMGDKGLGPALGPEATAAAERHFLAAGFDVHVASSPWRLGPTDAALIVALLQGWVAAATEQRPSDSALIRAWAARRWEDVRAARITLEVGHFDLLALPQAR